MASSVVPPIALAGTGASAPTQPSQQTGPHWTEQSVAAQDKARMGQAMTQNAQAPVSAPTPNATPNPTPIPGSDILGHQALFAALEKLRTAPAERMPVVAAELMVQGFEYQFNVTAVTHAARNVEEGVQTMTTRT